MLLNNENEMELVMKMLTGADKKKISFLYWTKEKTENSDNLDSTKARGYTSRKKIATVKTMISFETIKKIIVVTDSPRSLYRNRFCFL